jgi:hypothetical protein
MSYPEVRMRIHPWMHSCYALWIANQYISSSGGDSGKTRIPTLIRTPTPGTEEEVIEAVTNEEKSKILVTTMFPGKPENYAIQGNRNYPEQLPMRGEITHKQIKRHLDKLSPYKATGTNEIPNIVLKKCTDILLPYLIQIFMPNSSCAYMPKGGKKSSPAFYDNQESQDTTY